MFLFFKKLRDVVVRTVKPRRRRKGFNQDPDFVAIRALAEAVDELRECEEENGGISVVEKPYWKAVMQIGRAEFSRDPGDIALAREMIEKIKNPVWRGKARGKIFAVLAS